MLLLLERHELTVSELCAVLQLPQSTVSRHLKTLADASWVDSRRDGTSRYYTLSLDERGAPARRLWSLLREQVSATAGRRSGRAASEERARAAPVEVAGVLRVRRRAVGQAARGAVRRGLAPAGAAGAARRAWTVGDLGCGTGQVAAALAPFVARVIAVDRSGEMLQAARRRLRELPNVEVRRGELEALPIADGELDAATLLLVLHHLAGSGARRCRGRARAQAGRPAC